MLQIVACIKYKRTGLLPVEGFYHVPTCHMTTLDLCLSGEWGPRAHVGFKTWSLVSESR
jgi:hypothetical protein